MISVVSNSYYGMPRGQIHINLPPEHPIMSFETIEIKMVTVSVKRSISLTSRARVFSQEADGALIMYHSYLNNMEIPGTKRFILKGFELGTTLSLPI